jgi:dynein heavy chain, axonemal
MITSCKEYISTDGGSKIWEQDRKELFKKMNDCVKLNEAYQKSFHETKVSFIILLIIKKIFIKSISI